MWIGSAGSSNFCSTIFVEMAVDEECGGVEGGRKGEQGLITWVEDANGLIGRQYSMRESECRETQSDASLKKEFGKLILLVGRSGQAKYDDDILVRRNGVAVEESWPVTPLVQCGGGRFNEERGSSGVYRFDFTLAVDGDVSLNRALQLLAQSVGRVSGFDTGDELPDLQASHR